MVWRDETTLGGCDGAPPRNGASAPSRFGVRAPGPSRSSGSASDRPWRRKHPDPRRWPSAPEITWVIVIDDNLGLTGASNTDGHGLQKLVAEVGLPRLWGFLGSWVTPTVRNFRPLVRDATGAVRYSAAWCTG